MHKKISLKARYHRLVTKFCNPLKMQDALQSKSDAFSGYKVTKLQKYYYEK